MKIEINRTVLDRESPRKTHIIIQGKDYGEYSMGTFSAWCEMLAHQGKEVPPDTTRFINGLIFSAYNIDLWGSVSPESIHKILGKSLGEWFQEYMTKMLLTSLDTETKYQLEKIDDSKKKEQHDNSI